MELKFQSILFSHKLFVRLSMRQSKLMKNGEKKAIIVALLMLNSSGYIDESSAVDFLKAKLKPITLGSADGIRYNLDRKGIHQKIFGDHYYNKYPHLVGKIQIHHALPQWLVKYKLLTKEQVNSLWNLRGISKTIPELDTRLHQSYIILRWNAFENDHIGLLVKNDAASRAEVLEKAKEVGRKIDEEFGHLFWPPRGYDKYY